METNIGNLHLANFIKVTRSQSLPFGFEAVVRTGVFLAWMGHLYFLALRSPRKSEQFCVLNSKLPQKMLMFFAALYLKQTFRAESEITSWNYTALREEKEKDESLALRFYGIVLAS